MTLDQVGQAVTNILLNPTTGNVGVGTANPLFKFDVAGIAQIQDYLRTSFVVSTSTATSTFSGGLYGSLISAPYIHATSTTATSTFAGGAVFATGGGNVGIGTSSPFTTLSVMGNSYIVGNETASYFTATSTTVSSVFNGGITTSGLSGRTIYTTQAGAITSAATWGGGLPGPYDNVIIKHATTLSNATTTYNSLVVDGLNGGTLTITGTSTINSNASTTAAAANAIILNSNAYFTLNGNFTNYTISMYRGISLPNSSSTFVLNGNLINQNDGAAVRTTGTRGTNVVIINGNITNNGAGGYGLFSTGNMVVRGMVTNNAPGGSGYGEGVDLTGTTGYIFGDIFSNGYGWSAKNNGSGILTVYGNAHQDRSPIGINGSDCVDSGDGGGTYNLYGNVYDSGSDYAVVARNNSTVNIYGDVFHSDPSGDHGLYVKYSGGVINVYGNVDSRGTGGKDIDIVSGGIINLYGTTTASVVNIDSGGVLNTYGVVASASFTNNGIWNHAGIQPAVTTPGVNNFIYYTSPSFSSLIVNSNVGIGTSTPASLLHVSAGTNATTTVEFGAEDVTSKTCFNVRNNTGAATSFYFVGTTMVIEPNRCR